MQLQSGIYSDRLEEEVLRMGTGRVRNEKVGWKFLVKGDVFLFTWFGRGGVEKF
jgi:hypothetical protein